MLFFWSCMWEKLRVLKTNVFSLFSFTLVYFLVGAIYNGLVKHRSGINLIPQAEFWIGLPLHAIVSEWERVRIVMNEFFYCRKVVEVQLLVVLGRHNQVHQHMNLFKLDKSFSFCLTLYFVSVFIDWFFFLRNNCLLIELFFSNKKKFVQ